MQMISITGQEAKEHLRIYKKSGALNSIKKILTNTPERVEQFGLEMSSFDGLEQDIQRLEKDYESWCYHMEQSYGIVFDEEFRYGIDYIDKTISY